MTGKHENSEEPISGLSPVASSPVRIYRQAINGRDFCTHARTCNPLTTRQLIVMNQPLRSTLHNSCYPIATLTDSVVFFPDQSMLLPPVGRPGENETTIGGVYHPSRSHNIRPIVSMLFDNLSNVLRGTGVRHERI